MVLALFCVLVYGCSAFVSAKLKEKQRAEQDEFARKALMQDMQKYSGDYDEVDVVVRRYGE